VSYDVHLMRFSDGDAVPAESSLIRHLIESAWQAPPDEFECCRVRRGADEGDLYGFGTGESFDGLMFNHAGEEIYTLMYDIALAADLVIVPPDVGPFLVREGQRHDLPEDLAGSAVVAESGADLIRAVESA
jgi:hypothetical protein